MELHVGGFDRQAAALLHGIARVDHEVHDDLFELPRVRPHQREIGRQHEVERDVFADEPAEHLADAGDQHVQIDERGLQHLRAAEREELFGQARGALRPP